MINKEEMIRMLVAAYPGFREAVVRTANDWISDDGTFRYYIMISPLSDLLVKNIGEGNYENSDELFVCIEALLKDGEAEVTELISCGFLESLQSQVKVDARYWAPLLGREAVAFCKAMDNFHGVSVEHYRGV